MLKQETNLGLLALLQKNAAEKVLTACDPLLLFFFYSLARIKSNIMGIQVTSPAIVEKKRVKLELNFSSSNHSKYLIEPDGVCSRVPPPPSSKIYYNTYLS